MPFDFHSLKTDTTSTPDPLPPPTKRSPRTTPAAEVWTQMSSEVLATKLSKIDRSGLRWPPKPTAPACQPLPVGKSASRVSHLTGYPASVNRRCNPPHALFAGGLRDASRGRRLLRRRDKLQEAAVSPTTYVQSYRLATVRQGGFHFFAPQPPSIGKWQDGSSAIQCVIRCCGPLSLPAATRPSSGRSNCRSFFYGSSRNLVRGEQKISVTTAHPPSFEAPPSQPT